MGLEVGLEVGLSAEQDQQVLSSRDSCPGLQTETSGDESEPSVNSDLRVCHAADLPERWHGVRDASLNGNSQERTFRQRAE